MKSLLETEAVVQYRCLTAIVGWINEWKTEGWIAVWRSLG